MDAGRSATSTVGRWRVWLRGALSLLVLGLLVSHLETAPLLALLARVEPLRLAVAFLALLASALAGGGVWASVFPPACRLRAGEVLRFTLVGYAINSVVPSGIAGDVYRAWVVARRGMGWPLACYTVLMDRWCAFLVLLLGLAGAAAVLATGASGQGREAARLVAGCVVALSLVFGLASLILLAWGGRLPSALRHALRGAERFMPEICDRMKAFVRSPEVLVTFAWALLSMGLEGASIALTAWAVGVSGNVLTFAVVAPVFRVMHRVPGFVNAIGPQEMAAVAVWGSQGFNAETALTVSLVLHALRIGVGLVGVPLYVVEGRDVPTRALASMRQTAGEAPADD